jgi:hypothetical protein
MTKEGVKTYYHSALAGAIVKPGDTLVMAVMAEMIGNGDGGQKRDCELTAAKRLLQRHGAEYWWLKPALLGDDLYAHEPFYRQVQETGYGFIFTCKDTTHRWLKETMDNSEREELTHREWNGRYHMVYNYRWENRVPVRYEEREGYNLEHNFGHGEDHASENFWLLNLPVFLFHTILCMGDERYRKAGDRFGRRDGFFNALRYTFCCFLHENRLAFILFVWGDEPDG